MELSIRAASAAACCARPRRGRTSPCVGGGSTPPRASPPVTSADVGHALARQLAGEGQPGADEVREADIPGHHVGDGQGRRPALGQGGVGVIQAGIAGLVRIELGAGHPFHRQGAVVGADDRADPVEDSGVDRVQLLLAEVGDPAGVHGRGHVAGHIDRGVGRDHPASGLDRAVFPPGRPGRIPAAWSASRRGTIPGSPRGWSPPRCRWTGWHCWGSPGPTPATARRPAQAPSREPRPWIDAKATSVRSSCLAVPDCANHSPRTRPGQVPPAERPSLPKIRRGFSIRRSRAASKARSSDQPRSSTASASTFASTLRYMANLGRTNSSL